MSKRVLACLVFGLVFVAGERGRATAAGPDPADGGFPNVSTLDPDHYREVVGWAHQAVKLVYAPLTAEQEKQIDKAWGPAYGFPCPALVDYLNALLPVLVDYLAARGEASIVAPQFDAAYRAALEYQAVKDRVSTEEALAVAWVKKQQLVHLLERMADAAERVRKLGDPPDPNTCRARRRAQHEESVKAMGPGPVTTGSNCWVLTRHEVVWTVKPHVDRTVTGDWAETWSWAEKKDGTSVTTDMRLQWRHLYSRNGQRITTTGFVQNNLRVGWAQVPTVVPFVPDKDVPGSTFMHVPFFVEDTDLRDKNPTCGGDQEKELALLKELGTESITRLVNGKYVPVGPGCRSQENSFSAVMVAPDGRPQEGAYGGCKGGERYADTGELDFRPREDLVLQVQFRFDPGWWRIPYEKAGGKWNPSWDDQKPGTGWKMLLELHVTQTLSYQSGSNVGKFMVVWEYTFDPTGGSVAPLDLGEAATSGEQVNTNTPQDSARAAEEAAAREDMIAFHRADIQIAEKNIAKWRLELVAATDSKAREQLLHTLLHAERTRYAAMDRIRELQTGEYVHTRTPIDDWYSARFMQQVRDRMDPDSQIRRNAEGAQRLLRLVPADQREPLANFVARHTKDAEAWGDVSKMKKITHVVSEKVQGHWENVAATETEKALIAEYNLNLCRVAKYTCEAEMFVATLGGSGWSAMPVFEGCMGFAGAEQGGLGNRCYEGAKSALAWTSPAGMAAAEAMEGYEKGGWLSGQKGWVGALERGAETYLAVKGFEYAVGRLFGAGAPAGKKPDIKKVFEEARYRIAMEDSKQLVDEYKRAYEQYQRAMEFGANGAEIAALEKGLRDRASLLHSTYEGKLVLKASTRDPAYAQMIADYNQRMAQVHEQVQARFRQLMSERGYDGVRDWVMQEMRNAANIGTVGMDYDIALMRRYLNPSSFESRVLTEIRFTRDRVPISQAQLQADAQAAWDAAYESVTGRSASHSFENLTTTAHPESYADLTWLGDSADALKRLKVAEIAADKAGQAADVTSYKVADMMRDNSLLPVSRMVESARGMAKDTTNKLLPLLEEAAARSPEAAARFHRYRSQWKQLATAFEDAIANPSRANEQVRLLTGGKDIPEVALDLRDMIANYGKALGH
jgi:hypothetical protein